MRRRAFLRAGGMATAGLAAGALGQAHASMLRRRRAAPALVCVALRGGADGLGLIVPHSDHGCSRHRPSLRLRTSRSSGCGGLLDLGAGFALHPALAALHPWFRRGNLAIVHAVGGPHAHQSHFEAQRFADTCLLPGASGEGWLGRTLACVANAGAPARGVSFGHGASRLFSPHEHGRLPAQASFAEQMRHIAMLLIQDPTLRAAAVELSGWDTHVHQGAADGALADRAAELATGVAEFAHVLGSDLERVVVVMYSEFGRSIGENSAGGTEHGHGGVVLALGGSVRGGRVITRWPSLDGLQPSRGLPATTDLRDALGEIVARHLGSEVAEQVFHQYRQLGPAGDRRHLVIRSPERT